MVLNRAYFIVKPFVPWTLRLALRRIRASGKRVLFRHAWPIDKRAGKVPPGWPGWPMGKRFALVLTHDVEGLKGLGRIEWLMNLEYRLGFRSSFNLVPEGEYRVTENLRRVLEQAGFEIGVHGLNHDGKLFASRTAFRRKAAQIRVYLQDWKAAGFRSPFMHHKLEWLHDLGVEYDASTFDTDPFEPQPDGVRTIFPFWVPGPGGSGYVELPYTLVQDFNLFAVLRERNIDVWKRKVDWLAERGGMVLVSTHPDYMCAGDGAPARDEYPAGHYAELLTYIKNTYEGAFWHALPRDVARFYRDEVRKGAAVQSEPFETVKTLG